MPKYRISPVNTLVQELSHISLSEAPKGLRVVSCVKVTQASENPFLMIIQVDLKHELLIQSEVPL